MNDITFKYIAEDLGLHIEKISNDGIESWGMTPEEVIEEMSDYALLLEKIARGISICDPDSESVMEYLINRYEWERSQDDDLYDSGCLIPLIVAISNSRPFDAGIDGQYEYYYADVIHDEFIFCPKEAREADPEKFVMTKEFYEYGISWFLRSTKFQEEFEEIYGISWPRAINEWSDQWINRFIKLDDWAGYMLDRLEDSYADGRLGRKFALLKMR